jgi:hypothetical protein
MRKGFLIYEKMRKNISSYLRRPLVIYDFANCSILNFLIYEEIFFSSFIIAANVGHRQQQGHLMLLRAGMSVRVGIQQQGHLQHPSDVANSGNASKIRDSTTGTPATTQLCC